MQAFFRPLVDFSHHATNLSYLDAHWLEMSHCATMLHWWDWWFRHLAVKQPWLPKQGTWAVPLFLLPLTLQQAPDLPASQVSETTRLMRTRHTFLVCKNKFWPRKRVNSTTPCHTPQQPLKDAVLLHQSNHPLNRMLSFHLTSTSETENAPLRGVSLPSTFSSLGTKLHCCHCRQGTP